METSYGIISHQGSQLTHETPYNVIAMSQGSQDLQEFVRIVAVFDPMRFDSGPKVDTGGIYVKIIVMNVENSPL